jgi:uncharacterized protein YecE (DUF72 family)
VTAGGPILRVGCPMWAHRPWVGPYLPADTRPGGELAAYARWCTAVEGNTTFYALPAERSVARWVTDTPAGFRFVCKLPRTVTHDRRLRHADEEVAAYLDRLAPLAEAGRLGPTSVQLPPSFGPDELDVLDRFLAALPGPPWHWAVEVRHPDLAATGAAEPALHELLHRRGADLVVLDSRALFAAPPRSPEEHEAWRRKPRLPVRPVATGWAPVIRIIGQSDPEATAGAWRPWVPKVAAWLGEGRTPIVFLHTPDNQVSPALARRFHAEVAAVVPALEPLPDPEAAAGQLPLL